MILADEDWEEEGIFLSEILSIMEIMVICVQKPSQLRQMYIFNSQSSISSLQPLLTVEPQAVWNVNNLSDFCSLGLLSLAT